MVVLIAAILIIFVNVKRKTITVVVNGQPTKFVTYKSTIEDALKKKNITIGPKDYISPSLNSRIKENETINIKKAVNIKIEVDGKELALISSEDSVGLMLKTENISLSDSDKVKPALSTPITEGMNVEVIRVQTKSLFEVKPIKYNEIVKVNTKLANTKRYVRQEGKTGEKRVSYSVVYENGIEVSRTTLKESIIKNPVDKVIEQGGYPLMPVSRGGSIMPYSRVIKARATAYWAVRGVGKTYTASGRKAIRNPEGYSTIAVDPSIFPYGTKLFIEGYGFAVAADTGTAIVGNKIDVFFDTYKEACSYGAKYVNVYRLD